MPHVLKIRLYNSAGVFYPGQLLAGQVLLHTTETININEVTVRLKGHCHVEWTVKRNKRRVIHEQNEIYFDIGIRVGGTGLSSSLASGHHTYDFSFLLPPSIPSSYEGTYGSIRYTCQARVHKSALLSFDWSEKIGFSIISVLDLNLQPELLSPRSFQYDKKISFLLIDYGHVYCDVTIPRTGYVCGETVSPIIKIENKSSKTVEKITVGLKQDSVFRAQGLVKYGSNMITKIDVEGCEPNTSKVLDNITLMIPALPPSELTHCSLIDVSFFLWVEVHLPLFVRNIKLPMNITIGSIPFRSFSHDYYPHTPVINNRSISPSAPVANSQRSSSPNQRGPELPVRGYDAPPPSYEQAMSSVDNFPESKKEEDFLFVPKYAVYRAREQHTANQLPLHREKW